jgi:DNA-binding transcriptional LysR family regulator
VVETGSNQAAAERLHRTQPAVSQRVRSLETQCGDLLLDRRTRKPTAAGRIVFERGQALLRGAESLEAEVRESVKSGGELRVGTSDTNALYFLPQRVRAFSRSMPAVRVFIHCRSSEEVAREVERGDLDLGIVTLPTAHAGLEERPLFEQRLVVVVPKGHALSGRTRTNLDALRNEPMVLMQRETRTGTHLREFFRGAGFEPVTVMDSGSFEVIKQYVAEGVGISIVPELALRKEDLKRLARVQLPGLPGVEIGVVWRSGGYLPLAAQVFLDLLLDASSPDEKRRKPEARGGHTA